MSEDEEIEYEEDEEGALIFDAEDVRANSWTLTMVFAELFKNLFACGATFFNALSILSESKSDQKEATRQFHNSVTAELETLPTTEE
jgi:hypothetical protein